MKKRNIVQKGVTFALTAAMAGSSFVSAFPVLAAEDDSKSIVALTTDGLTNPLGVDTLTPVFTWQMESGKTGASPECLPDHGNGYGRKYCVGQRCGRKRRIH